MGLFTSSISFTLLSTTSDHFSMSVQANTLSQTIFSTIPSHPTNYTHTCINLSSPYLEPSSLQMDYIQSNSKLSRHSKVISLRNGLSKANTVRVGILQTMQANPTYNDKAI